MLAGIEETVYAREPLEVSDGTTAIETLLAGLVDYAGLYPPASLDMGAAVGNYRRYRIGKYAFALGRFIVDISRVDELRAAAGDLRDLRLGIIVPGPALVVDALSPLIDAGVSIEALEVKAAAPGDVDRVTRNLPAKLETYIELPIEAMQADLLRAISNAGARVKLRMGGVVAEAFPSSAAVARAIASLVQARLAFKATAGFHHPIRSRHRLAYAHDSPSGMMHGFINLICAAALLHFGADVAEAESALEEEDPGAWSLTPQVLTWRSHSWSVDQLRQTRKQMFVSFGSCSFEEPIRDLEALGWL
jgi:hypothetical protein